MKLNLKSKSLNNLGIILSLGFIFFCFLISIFSYLIIPDKSKFSNQMHLPIHSKEPGFKADFILVPNENSDNLDYFFLYYLFLHTKAHVGAMSRGRA